jgi:transposase
MWSSNIWQPRVRSPQPLDEKIRRLYAQGVGTRELAERFGLSQRAIQDALNAKKFLTAARPRHKGPGHSSGAS